MKQGSSSSGKNGPGREPDPVDAGIGGVDEAGRGPLAGPVVAAAVVLWPDQRLAGVGDSKKIPAERRERLAVAIKAEAAAWQIGVASVREIDQLNILQATMLAMRRAIAGLGCRPGLIRVDGNRVPDVPEFDGVIESLIGGDRTCGAISAASILAKVYRDELMIELDSVYPDYGFARHKGYPTRQHRDALLHLGPCPEHRRSFRPVRLAEVAG